jgi:hypothetical protein
MAVLQKTLADIRADVQQRLDELGADPYTSSELDDYVNLALAEWAMRVHCCRQEVTVELTAGTRAYNLDEGVLVIYDGHLTTAGDVWKWNLGPVRREAVMSRAATTGDPTHYFIYGWDTSASVTEAFQRQIHFYPLPGTTGQKAVMDCATLIPTLTADTHIPKMPPEQYGDMYDYAYYLALERDNDPRALVYLSRFEIRAKRAAVREKKLQRDEPARVRDMYGGSGGGVKPLDRNVGQRYEELW